MTQSSHSWVPSRWSLTRKLPVLTAATVVIVVGMSLSATYQALVQARSEALHERLTRVVKQLAISSGQGNQTRFAALRSVARDSAIVQALRAGRTISSVPASAPLGEALARVRQPVDSQMAVELWTAGGRRIAQIGVPVPADPMRDVAPESRSLGGTPLVGSAPAPSLRDSVHVGALYPVAGRVYYWTLVPVMYDGQRLGYIAQQRRISSTPQAVRTVRELIGSDVTVYVRNSTDGFWASLMGEPLAPPTGRDTTADGFMAMRPDGPQLGVEAHVPNSPWMLTLEAPAATLLIEPRATVRRLFLFSAVITVVGVIISWIVSRRITRPLVDLTNAASAIAEGDYRRRVRARRSDGDEIHRLAASFNHMANEVETAQGALATQVNEARDTSLALHRASIEAVEARDAAEEANKAKSEFLAVMSHELRTPLNAIGGYAEILEMGIYGPVTTQQQDAIARIARSQQTLLSLINDVLNFAKLEAGEVHFAMQDVAVGAALESLDAMIAPQIASRRLRYAVRGCPPGLVVRADPEKLQQVLLNLLSNAIKFTAEEGEITVACRTAGTRAFLDVRDSGIGIAEDRLLAIFDPFIQVGRSLNRPHEGVGLGLSISRDLAAGMGGSLTVQSTVGVGSTFTVELELAEGVGPGWGQGRPR